MSIETELALHRWGDKMAGRWGTARALLLAQTKASSDDGGKRDEGEAGFRC